MAARAAAALRSNSSRIRAVLSSAANLGAGAPGGMISSSSSVTACTAQAGSSAISVARRPSVIDLGCGFQADLPSGTRSSTRRVAAISSSNSGISHSASGMHGLRHSSAAKVVGGLGRGKQMLMNLLAKHRQRASVAVPPKPRSIAVSGTRKATWYRWDDLPREQLHERLSRRLVTGDRMMLAHVYLKKGCVVPRHSHENEQLTYILEGGLRFWIGEEGSEVIDVMAGEVLHIPSHVLNKVEPFADKLTGNASTLPRQDWLDKTDDYLRQK